MSEYLNNGISRSVSQGSIIPPFQNSIIALVCLLLLLGPASSLAQDISISASTGKTSYVVGDYIHYKIEVVHGKNIEVVAPSMTDSLKSVSLLQIEKPVNVQKSGKITTVFEYILSGYDSAFVTIPPIPVKYRVAGDTSAFTITTNPVSFRINLVKVNPSAGIKDVKSPFSIPLNWLWIALWIFVAFILIAAVYYLYRRRRKKQPSVEVPVAPKLLPDEIALNALRKLEAQKLWQKGLIKEYHSTITEIIRKYFEDRFDMPALELTTTETVDLLRKREGTQPILDLTHDFLSNADLVKFAKYLPLDSVNQDMMEQAYEIVNKTILPKAEDQKSELTNVQ